MDAASRIAELEEEVRVLREQLASNVCHVCKSGRVGLVSPGRAGGGGGGGGGAPAPAPRPPMPKASPSSVSSNGNNNTSLPPPSLVTHLPPLPRERVLPSASPNSASLSASSASVVMGSRKSLGPEDNKPSLPALPLPSLPLQDAAGRMLSKSARGERSQSVSESGQTPITNPRPSISLNPLEQSSGFAFNRSPRASSIDVHTNNHNNNNTDDYFSVTLRGLVDEAGVHEAIGGSAKLTLSVSSVASDGKSFIVKANLSKWSWSLPRSYASFQALSKAIGNSVSSNDLPKLKPTLGDQERVMVLNAYLMEICNQLGSQLSLALLRFVDPFDAPSTFSLKLMSPLHEGSLDLTVSKGSKPQPFFFVLRENLYYFRSNNEDSPVGVLSLEYVTLEIVVDSAFPRNTFSISSLQKEPIAFLSADSTKSMSEWILKIRRAKFLRTGMTYGVASASTIEDAAVLPRVSVVKEMFAAYLQSSTLPPLTEALAVNPLEWIYCADGPDNLVLQEGSIREATVQKLTERILDDQLSSTHFVSVFMATCRYWLKPMDLFCYLVDAWNSAPMEVDVSSKQVRLLLILRLWITHHFADLYDNHLLAKHVLHFIHTRLTNPIFQKYTAVLLDNIREHVAASSITGGANPLLPAVFSKEHIEIIDFHPLEIARQMTLYSFGLFCAIEPSEILQQRWNSPDKEKLCPNVMRMIRRFNTVSLWVQTVLLSLNSLDVRVAILSRLLEVCVHLLELNNFSSVWELCSGLQGSAVRRLSDTWDRLSEESAATWKRLLEFCDSSANFKQYRTRLAESIGPSIPHVGRYLSDLTFAEDASKTFVDKRVNFGKALVIGSVLMDIQKRQRIKYAIKSVDSFQNYFQRLSPLTEDALFALSLRCQPREEKK